MNVKPGISDHDCVDILCDIKPAKVKSPSRKVFLWKKANYQATSDDIAAVEAELSDRPHPTCPGDLDANWNLLHSTLLDSNERKVPSKMTTNKCSQPWTDTPIRCDLRKNRKLIRKARKPNQEQTPRICDWNNWFIAGDKSHKTILT